MPSHSYLMWLAALLPLVLAYQAMNFGPDSRRLARNIERRVISAMTSLTTDRIDSLRRFVGVVAIVLTMALPVFSVVEVFLLLLTNR